MSLPMAPYSVRLDADTIAALDWLASERGTNRSEEIRKAVAAARKDAHYQAQVRRNTERLRRDAA